jgi:hypothetical protein
MVYKIIPNILHEWLQPYVEKIVENYECGFRVGKSTIDQIQILEQTMEYGVSTSHLFITFRAAYDIINREKLFKV